MELTDKIRRVYLPMTETGFYILFCLQKENHGPLLLLPWS